MEYKKAVKGDVSLPSLKKNRRKGARYAVICLLLLACIGGWWYKQDKDTQASVVSPALSDQTSLSEQVHTLKELVVPLAEGEESLQTRIMIQGSFKFGELGWEAERAQWQQSADIPAVLHEIEERGRFVNRAAYSLSPTGSADVLLFYEDDGLGYYVISLNSKHEAGLQHITEEALRLLKQLEGSGYAPRWNASVQISAAQDYEHAWQRIEEAVEGRGQAIPIDRYEEKRTISVAFETNYMSNGVEMNGKTANLQAAVHEDRTLGMTRITLGTPLIAGEY